MVATSGITLIAVSAVVVVVQAVAGACTDHKVAAHHQQQNVLQPEPKSVGGVPVRGKQRRHVLHLGKPSAPPVPSSVHRRHHDQRELCGDC